MIGQLTDAQWEMVMPPEFATRSQHKITLREVVNEHAYDDAWVPGMLAGKTEVPEDAPLQSNLLGLAGRQP